MKKKQAIEEKSHIIDMEPIYERNQIGILEEFNNKKNFGFLKPRKGDFRNIFIHHSQMPMDQLKLMIPGQRIKYDFVIDGEGVHAENVSVVIDENTLRPAPPKKPKLIEEETISLTKQNELNENSENEFLEEENIENIDGE